MAYLIKDDLKTHLYAEITDEITRADDALITKAISAGIAEAKSYLSRYDLLKLFGDANTDPEIEDEHLKNIVKDVVCWQLIKLSNPNINMELFRTMYEDAIKWLEKVMKGQADPEGWPYKADDAATDFDESASIQWSSNPKRTQHF